MTLRSPDRVRGFTLLELLVVLVMLGIILTIAVLSLGDAGRGDRIREEARRLQALLSLVADEAVLNSEALGLVLQPEGYHFLRYQDGRWRPFEGDSLYLPRSWAPGVEAQLFVEGRLQPYAEARATTPAVIFYPDGERSPFELVLGYREAPQLRHRIEGNIFGPLGLHAETTE